MDNNNKREACGKKEANRETQEDGTLEMTRGERQMGNKGKEDSR